MESIRHRQDPPPAETAETGGPKGAAGLHPLGAEVARLRHRIEVLSRQQRELSDRFERLAADRAASR